MTATESPSFLCSLTSDNPTGGPLCQSLRIGIWEPSPSFVYDKSAEEVGIRAEVTIVAGVGGFGPQLGSRAGALVSVLHAETEL